MLLVVVFSVAHRSDAGGRAAPRAAPSSGPTFVFTGLLGIQRGFVLERENDCLGGLLASPLDPAALYLGKLAANVVLLGGHAGAGGAAGGASCCTSTSARCCRCCLVVLLLGNLGFAALATLFAAMTVRTRAREVHAAASSSSRCWCRC